MLTIGNAFFQTQMIDGDQFVSLYPTNPLGGLVSNAGSPKDLVETFHLRFDPVSACNARCAFCHTDFTNPVRHLSLEDMQAVADVGLPKLRTIAVGCAYEPLMGKFFEQYPSTLDRYKGQATARVITNGFLLHKKDIGPWVDFGLEYMHVSVHSHDAEIYSNTMRNGMKLDQVVRNLVATRVRFPDVRIIFINVVCRLNNYDIAGYCQWAFEELGVNQVVLVRATLGDSPQPQSPAGQFVAERGREGLLSDEEWSSVIKDCAPFLDGSHQASLPELGSSIATLTIDRPIRSRWRVWRWKQPERSRRMYRQAP